MMADTESSAKRFTPRWIKIVLALSLALNFIFVGLGAGLLMRAHDARGPVARDAALMLARALPRSDRREVFREFRRRRGDVAASFPDLPRVRTRIAEVLQTKPFDAEALRRVLGEQRKRGAEIADAGRATIVDHLANMTDGERAEIALRLLRGRQKRSK